MNWKERAAVFLTEKAPHPVPTKLTKGASGGFGSRGQGVIPEIKKALGLQDETATRTWLAHIEETDSDLIEGVLEQCRADPEACAYFLHRAEEVPTGRCCAECDQYQEIV